MTRTKQRYDEYCKQCTEVMKHCDPDQKINCLKTAQHILVCNREYLETFGKDIFNFYNPYLEDTFVDKQENT